MRVELEIKCHHMAHLFAKHSVLPNHFLSPISLYPPHSLSLFLGLSPSLSDLAEISKFYSYSQATFGLRYLPFGFGLIWQRRLGGMPTLDVHTHALTHTGTHTGKARQGSWQPSRWPKKRGTLQLEWAPLRLFHQWVLIGVLSMDAEGADG